MQFWGFLNFIAGVIRTAQPYTREIGRCIVEAQVFGIPDERYGEIVCAWVQQREGSNLTEAGVKDYCADQITHFKVPSLVRFVDEFPMTVTGKIQKFKMRDATVEELST